MYTYEQRLVFVVFIYLLKTKIMELNRVLTAIVIRFGFISAPSPQFILVIY